jgi:hypothetical protein
MNRLSPLSLPTSLVSTLQSSEHRQMRLLATDAELKHGARSPRPLLLADILCQTDLRHVVSCRTAAAHSCHAGLPCRSGKYRPPPHRLTCTYKRPARPPWLDTSVKLERQSSLSLLVSYSSSPSPTAGSGVRGRGPEEAMLVLPPEPSTASA